MELLIFCVETNKKANTDPYYIEKTIRYFYNIPANTKIQWEYMNSKTRYNDKTLLNKIKKYSSGKNITHSHVFYCIDVDGIQKDNDAKKEDEKIENFCKENNFSFIWFCRDVEEVYWGKQVDDAEKTSQAKRFSNLKYLGTANSNTLSSKRIARKKSNILLVIDEFLPRKDI